MKTAFEYDVVLSFAGEDREFVEACAEILRSLNVNVFYDNYEKEILLGKNLYSYLADIYQIVHALQLFLFPRHIKKNDGQSMSLSILLQENFDKITNISCP